MQLVLNTERTLQTTRSVRCQESSQMIRSLNRDDVLLAERRCSKAAARSTCLGRLICNPSDDAAGQSPLIRRRKLRQDAPNTYEPVRQECRDRDNDAEYVRGLCIALGITDRVPQTELCPTDDRLDAAHLFDPILVLMLGIACQCPALKAPAFEALAGKL